jgi:hypothetical protein
VKHSRIDLTFGELCAVIDAACGLNYFSNLKNSSWRMLNSYTHTGMLQVGRRFTGDKLAPSYTDEERIEVVRAITFFLLLLVRPFFSQHGQQDSAKEIDKLMAVHSS